MVRTRRTRRGVAFALARRVIERSLLPQGRSSTVQVGHDRCSAARDVRVSPRDSEGGNDAPNPSLLIAGHVTARWLGLHREAEVEVGSGSKKQERKREGREREERGSHCEFRVQSEECSL
jgi:hypothetical protein